MTRWTKAKTRPWRRRHTPGSMTKLEKEYAEGLEMLLKGKAILGWLYEPLKLRLAKATFYAPDFLVQEKDTTITLVEVKGHWEDDARVKIKVAADKFPMFRFMALRKQKGAWVKEEIG